MDRPSGLFNQYCILVGFLSVLLYMYGFFPIKTSTNIFSSREDYPSTLHDVKFHKEKLYNSSVGTTVLMVIDGLRVDFVTAENMPYTGGLIAEGRGEACQLTARVSAPTVTLPRVKAIVTGTVSSFIDVVLNFGTKELTLDNIIHQASQTKKVVFYGDDTWVKLFPHHFARSDGTSSFFVNDYTEVDTNVTRHLGGEMQRFDWGVMVLHYLGLDHIGHIQGPKSPLIRPKLKEMDDVIAQLHTYLQKQGGMLLVCGDHGMKDSGSHGGVSLPEVLVPVLVLGLSCPSHFKEEILQVDLAATLSVLWGAPIPSDSIGVAAAGLLTHLTPAHRLYTRLYNAQQLASNFLRNGGATTHDSYASYEEAKQRHYEWLTNKSTVSHHQVEALYLASLIKMSRFLSAVLANYDMVALFSATAALFQVCCLLGLRLSSAHSVARSQVRSALLLSAVISVTLVAGCRLTSLCSFPYWPLAVSLTCVLVITFNTLLLYYQVKVASTSLVLKVVTLPASLSWSGLLPVGTLLFCVSLFSSSLLEEEHQLWYWLWATICVLRIIESPAPWLCVLVAHRFLRTINQTGDKWAHLPDLSDWLVLNHNRHILSALFLLGLVCVCWCCAKVTPHRLLVPLYLATALGIYIHKAAVQQVFIFTYPLSSR